jgi:hypothetical protein
MGRDIVAESRTLWYEFVQLCGAADELRRSEADPKRFADTVHNALVESFAIHPRILEEFFISNDGNALDVLDYISPAEWQTKRQALSEYLDSASDARLKRLGRSLASGLPTKRRCDGRERIGS